MKVRIIKISLLFQLLQMGGCCSPPLAEKNTIYSEGYTAQAFRKTSVGDSIKTVLDNLGPPINVTFSLKPAEPRIENLDRDQIIDLVNNKKVAVVLQYSESKDKTENCFIDVDIWIGADGEATHVRKVIYDEG